MNKYKLMLSLAFLATTLFTVGCSKFEDGPGISLRSAKARLAGEWQMVKYEYNGKEESLDADQKDDVWKFEKDGTLEYLDPGYSTEKSTWEFNKAGDKLLIMDEGSSDATVFTILRLANKEMIWQLADDGDKEIYTFEQK